MNKKNKIENYMYFGIAICIGMRPTAQNAISPHKQYK